MVCISARVMGSSAPNGSSINSIPGSVASARASPDPLSLPAGELPWITPAKLFEIQAR